MEWHRREGRRNSEERGEARRGEASRGEERRGEERRGEERGRQQKGREKKAEQNRSEKRRDEQSRAGQRWEHPPVHLGANPIFPGPHGTPAPASSNKSMKAAVGSPRTISCSTWFWRYLTEADQGKCSINDFRRGIKNLLYLFLPVKILNWFQITIFQHLNIFLLWGSRSKDAGKRCKTQCFSYLISFMSIRYPPPPSPPHHHHHQKNVTGFGDFLFFHKLNIRAETFQSAEIMFKNYVQKQSRRKCDNCDHQPHCRRMTLLSACIIPWVKLFVVFESLVHLL